jgi:hypothetical protein
MLRIKKWMSMSIASGLMLFTMGCQLPAGKAAAADSSATLNEIVRTQNQILPELTALKEEISALKESQTSEIQALNNKIDHQNSHSRELQNINNSINSLRNSLNSSANAKTPEVVKTMSNNSDNTAMNDGKLIFGEVEWIYIADADSSLEGRIDTGASISSISAKNVERFERDGKTWYRFTIPMNDSEGVTVEAPWVRTSTIRQVSNQSGIEDRPVVKMTFKVGSHTGKAEFSLKDRTTMVYPILIGREFIKDFAVVDVSRKHVQKRIDAKNIFSNYQDTKGNRLAKEKKEDIQAKPADNGKVNTSSTPAKKNQ